MDLNSAVKDLRCLAVLISFCLLTTRIKSSLNLLLLQTCASTINGLSEHVGVLSQFDVCRQDFRSLLQLNQRGHQVAHLERVKKLMLDGERLFG